MTPLSLQPPLWGDWLALNPPGHAPHVHDFVGLDPDTGRMAVGGVVEFLVGRLRAEDAFGWSAPVLAPLDGQVVASHDGEPDRRRLFPVIDAPATFLRPLFHRGRLEKVAGNHLVVSTAAGFILVAHLREGSLTVREGDEVRAGQPLASVGNSGNSMGPHLHIQVMEGPDPFTDRVIPYRLVGFQEFEDGTWTDRRDASLPDRVARVRFAF